MTARRFLLPVFPNLHNRGEIEELLEDLGTRKLSWWAGSQVQTSRVLCIRQEYVRYAEWDALVPARGSDLKFEPTGDGEDDNDTHTVPFSALIDLDESSPAIADGMRTTILSRAASIDVNDVEIDCRLDRDDRGALR